MSDPADIRSILATDCGSTTTKAILIELDDSGEYRLTVRGEAPTTVAAPVEDVTRGGVNAVTEVAALPRPKPPTDRLSDDSFGRAPGQHGVLGRDPPSGHLLAPHPWGNLILDSRRTDETGCPELDEGAPLGVLQVAGGDGEGQRLVGPSAVRAA